MIFSIMSFHESHNMERSTCLDSADVFRSCVCVCGVCVVHACMSTEEIVVIDECDDDEVYDDGENDGDDDDDIDDDVDGV